jgi:ATP phosphoribosyltransferase
MRELFATVHVMLRLVLPKGSLEKATLDLFDDADLRVRRDSMVAYKAEIDDPRVESVRVLRPQEIPHYVADGLFDLGITGRDWVEETGRDLVSLGELRYSKVSSNPVRIIVAVAGDSPAEKVGDLPDGVRVASEYPELTRRFFARHGVQADVRHSHGATEAKIPDIADAIVDITETGRALRAAGLRVLDTILTSYTELVANPASCADPAKRHAMDQIHTLLQGVLEARGRVLVKLNCATNVLDRVIAVLPAMKTPTVNELYGAAGYAVEAVVAKSTINTLIPELSAAGATDIIELPIAKIVH